MIKAVWPVTTMIGICKKPDAKQASGFCAIVMVVLLLGAGVVCYGWASGSPPLRNMEKLTLP